MLQVLLDDLHEALLADTTFGMDLCGLRPDGQVVHDPQDGTEACVLLQLTVDEDLEPEWTVVRPGAESGRRGRRASHCQPVDARRWACSGSMTGSTPHLR